MLMSMIANETRSRDVALWRIEIIRATSRLKHGRIFSVSSHSRRCILLKTFQLRKSSTPLSSRSHGQGNEGDEGGQGHEGHEEEGGCAGGGTCEEGQEGLGIYVRTLRSSLVRQSQAACRAIQRVHVHHSSLWVHHSCRMMWGPRCSVQPFVLSRDHCGLQDSLYMERAAGEATSAKERDAIVCLYRQS